MDLTEKTVSELEAPVVDMDVDRSAVDSNIDKKYNRGRVHVHARAMMPEKQLFSYAEYRAQEAERIGYSQYSYWKSVWRNFIKKKTAEIKLEAAKSAEEERERLLARLSELEGKS